MNNERHCYHLCYSGDSKGFRNSVSGTEDKIPTSYCITDGKEG